jgi:hypothetical protein
MGRVTDPPTTQAAPAGKPQGRDSQEGSTSTAAPEALAGIRSSRSEVTMRLMLVGFPAAPYGAQWSASGLPGFKMFNYYYGTRTALTARCPHSSSAAPSSYASISPRSAFTAPAATSSKR